MHGLMERKLKLDMKYHSRGYSINLYNQKNPMKLQLELGKFKKRLLNPLKNYQERRLPAMNREMVGSEIEWIGEMPRDWRLAKVKHIFYRSKEVNNIDNPTVLSLARSGIRVRDISNNEGQLAASYDNYNVVKKGDLLLNPMDLVSGANCNLSYVEGVISPAYVNLRKKEDVSSKFYDYYFKLQYWQKTFFAHGKGVSFENRWTLNNETLMNFPVPLPTTKEQFKIANFLDKKT